MREYDLEEILAEFAEQESEAAQPEMPEELTTEEAAMEMPETFR